MERRLNSCALQLMQNIHPHPVVVIQSYKVKMGGCPNELKQIAKVQKIRPSRHNKDTIGTTILPPRYPVIGSLVSCFWWWFFHYLMLWFVFIFYYSSPKVRLY